MNALWYYWHPVLWSKAVTDKPVPVKLLDQPLVIWRANGKLAAFYDLCLHRGAALSLGWLSGEHLVCAYHGWNYAADGRCTRIPSLPPDRRYPPKRAQKRFASKSATVWSGFVSMNPVRIFPTFHPSSAIRALTGRPTLRKASGAPTLRV